jgi:hypothetical protein
MMTAIVAFVAFVLGLAVMWRAMDESRAVATETAYEAGKDEILRWQWNEDARPLRDAPRVRAVSSMPEGGQS